MSRRVGLATLLLAAALISAVGPVPHAYAKPTPPPTPTEPPPTNTPKPPPPPTPTNTPPPPPTSTPRPKPASTPTSAPTVTRAPPTPTPITYLHAVTGTITATSIVTSVSTSALTDTPTASPSQTPTATSTLPVSSEDAEEGAGAGSSTTSTFALPPLDNPWLWGAGVLVLAIVGASTTIVTRALVYTRRDLSLKEMMLAQDVQKRIGPDDIVPRLGQLAFDASGERPEIDQILRAVGSPIPAILALGQGFHTYVFTPASPRVFRRHLKHLFGGPMKIRGGFRINANTSGPTVLHELERIWEIVVVEHGVPVPQRALPRTRQWWLYVVSPPGRQK